MFGKRYIEKNGIGEEGRKGCDDSRRFELKRAGDGDGERQNARGLQSGPVCESAADIKKKIVVEKNKSTNTGCEE